MERTAILVTLLCVAATSSLPAAEVNSDVEQYWSHDVTLQQLLDGALLPEGDVIRVREELQSCLTSDQIAVSLELVSPVTSWKALRLAPLAATDDYKVLTELLNNQVSVTVVFESYELFTNYFVLWKTGFLGAYVPMYRVADALDQMRGGYKYTFFWIAE